LSWPPIARQHQHRARWQVRSSRPLLRFPHVSHFVCHTSFTRPKCHERVSMGSGVLAATTNGSAAVGDIRIQMINAYTAEQLRLCQVRDPAQGQTSALMSCCLLTAYPLLLVVLRPRYADDSEIKYAIQVCLPQPKTPSPHTKHAFLRSLSLRMERPLFHSRSHNLSFNHN
jgi:hypothetical protein